VAKNKGTYRAQREEKQGEVLPEAVLAQHTTSFFTRHANKVWLAIGALVIGLVAVNLYRWRAGKREAAATGLFDESLRTLQASIGSAAPQMTAPGDEPPLSFPTTDARANAALGVLDQIGKEYDSTRVDDNVQLVRAGVLYELGRYDEAITLYRQVADSKLPDIHKLIAREGVARSIEAKALAQKDAGALKAGLADALAEYAKLQPDPKGLWADATLYHQARVSAKAGNTEGAKKLYKQLVDTMPASPFASEANDRLAALE
jgi:tetratricopeptide (TPR) repeat protein